ncbi:MAG: alpha/beta fold hydrolase [Solirubrobacteraceae bacterium]
MGHLFPDRGTAAADLPTRIAVVVGDTAQDALPSTLQADEVWLLSEHRLRPGVSAAWEARVSTLTSNLARTGAARVLSVVGPSAACAPAMRKQLDAIREECTAKGMDHRCFRAPILIDTVPPPEDPHWCPDDPDCLSSLLAALDQLKVEIEARLPRYFDHHALRCLAPAHAVLTLTRADRAAAAMLAAASQPSASGSDCYAVGEDVSTFASVCERIGEAYGLHLHVTSDPSRLNAVDRMFNHRLGELTSMIERLPEERTAPAARRLGDETPSPFDDAAQVELFAVTRRWQADSRDRRARQVSDAISLLETRTIDRQGSTLQFLTGGAGDLPVVLLNALGQRLHPWERLIEILTRSHRVITWDPRGVADAPYPLGLADHVEDLEAILHHVGAERCHLVAWCTGPKVALEFYRRRADAVETMTFLNSTFKWQGGPRELDSAYEQNLESLCRTLHGNPAIASWTASALRSSAHADPAVDMDSYELARVVASKINGALVSDVTAPLADAESLQAYVQQVLDFWSYDVRDLAPHVERDVLLVACEHDSVASPSMSLEMARLLPRAHHLLISGATHYCLYDRPELIAEVIESFLTEPRDMGRFESDQRCVRERGFAGQEAVNLAASTGISRHPPGSRGERDPVAPPQDPIQADRRRPRAQPRTQWNLSRDLRADGS